MTSQVSPLLRYILLEIITHPYGRRGQVAKIPNPLFFGK